MSSDQLQFPDSRHNHLPRCCCLSDQDHPEQVDGLVTCPACPEHGELTPGVECPQCHQPAGRPHTDYCTLDPERVHATMGQARVCALDGCPETRPHYHRGDDSEKVITDPTTRHPACTCRFLNPARTWYGYGHRDGCPLQLSLDGTPLGTSTSQPATRTSQPDTQVRDAEDATEGWMTEQAGLAARGKDHAPGPWCVRYCRTHEPTPLATPTPLVEATHHHTGPGPFHPECRRCQGLPPE